MRSTFFTLLAALALTAASSEPAAPPIQEWPAYAADPGASHYSPLTELDRSNIARLRPAWEWKPGEDAMPEFGVRPGMFENTPLMIDNVLYLSTSYNKVVALDAETGARLWQYDPKAYVDGQPPNGTGFVHRGVAAWRDGAKLRIFMNSRARLICLDAKTGQLVDSFGDHGIVNLTRGLRWEVDPKRYTNTSPPVIYKNLVILGNGVGDRLVYQRDPPGDVRAFDARTGKQVWTFHTTPVKGDPETATWANESWNVTGHANVWAPFSVDVQRGLVYLPVTTPSNDYYGAHRLGNNLFAESIVCLDAATGKRKWHFQIAHHGLWDYDPPASPVLVTMTVNDRRVDAVVQVTKQGFAFVFDRVTGSPIWPIEERPVPASDVPGEQASPTQPFPTRPPAISPQGVTLDDAFDLTPELKAQAQDAVRKYRLGPIYTPPSVQGTMMRPGVVGGANWGSAAFDAETGMLYVKTTNAPAVIKNRAGGSFREKSARVRSGRRFHRRRQRRHDVRAVEYSGRRRRPKRRAAPRETALRRAGRHRSEQRRHCVAGAVRRHAVHTFAPGVGRRRIAAAPRCGWRERRHRYQGRPGARGRRRQRALCVRQGHGAGTLACPARSSGALHADDVPGEVGAAVRRHRGRTGTDGSADGVHRPGPIDFVSSTGRLALERLSAGGPPGSDVIRL